MSTAKLMQNLLLVIIFIVIVLLIRSKKKQSSLSKQEPTLGACVANNLAKSDAQNDGLANAEFSKFPDASFEMIDSGLILFKIKPIDARPFMGYELLQSLLSLGFVYDETKIFNRYDEEDATKTPQVLFSLAAATESGTIELNDIGGFAAPGLVLFMRYKEQKHLSLSFDLMIEVLKQLTDYLGGVAYDCKGNQLTPFLIAELQKKVAVLEENNHYTSDLVDDNI
jgi:FtsZ-interacting cell division protein ZipA